MAATSREARAMARRPAARTLLLLCLGVARADETEETAGTDPLAFGAKGARLPAQRAALCPARC